MTELDLTFCDMHLPAVLGGRRGSEGDQLTLLALDMGLVKKVGEKDPMLLPLVPVEQHCEYDRD